MILDVSIDDSEYILINLCNANTEKEQINVLNDMLVLLEKFDTNPRNHLIMASKLDAQGGNPTIRRSL